ncbi:MAG: NAD(P)/FAD-dependent oxidoreductase [Christensenellaceae bacterium]|nr:NAD(P)/FAD-dependent oxidoreductase [Christensenellaceae bacterium]
MKNIAIIGGGAAGMLAALSAARNGAHVVLFEKNEKLGKKLFITGKGRCNVTNACETEDFFQNVPVNSKFLYSALYTFTGDQLREMLEEAGCPLKVERGGRVFPVSDKSSDILRTLEKLLRSEGVVIRLNQKVEKLTVEEGCVRGLVAGGKRQLFDAVILATGGYSYPLTGSTGDGHAMAKQAGHAISDIRPSLIPLLTKEVEICKEMTGLSLKNVRLTLWEGKKKRYSEQGEMMFAHFGITGPLVLSASAHLSDYAFKDTRIGIDLKPALSPEKLDARILRDFSAGPNKQLKNLLGELFPRKLIAPVLAQAGLDGDLPACQVTREQRDRLAAVTKDFRLHIRGTRPVSEAIITRGGVNVREADPSTMQSKKISGLFFAGELLDVDAYTGGFNLQIAFSTGYLAGLCAALAD